MMRYSVRLYMCLMMIMVLPVWAENPEIRMEPLIVTLNYATKEKKASTLIGFELFADEHGEKQVDLKYDTVRNKVGDSYNLKAVDSNGKELGTVVKVEKKFHEENPFKNGIFITFEELPSSGVEWIKLSGQLPLSVFSYQGKTEGQKLNLEEGEEINLDGITTKVEWIYGGESYFQARCSYSAEKLNIRIDQINIQAPDGEDIGMNIQYGVLSSMLKGTNESYHMTLNAPHPGPVLLSYRRWEARENMDCPIELTVYLMKTEKGKVE